MNEEQSWRAGRTEGRGGDLNGTNTRRGANGIDGGIPNASAGEAVGSYIEDSGIAGGKGERWRDRCAGTILSSGGEQQGGSHLQGETGTGVQGDFPWERGSSGRLAAAASRQKQKERDGEDHPYTGTETQTSHAPTRRLMVVTDGRAAHWNGKLLV